MYRPERLRLTEDTLPVILGKVINTLQHSLSCTYNCEICNWLLLSVHTFIYFKESVVSFLAGFRMSRNALPKESALPCWWERGMTSRFLTKKNYWPCESPGKYVFIVGIFIHSIDCLMCCMDYLATIKNRSTPVFKTIPGGGEMTPTKQVWISSKSFNWTLKKITSLGVSWAFYP